MKKRSSRSASRRWRSFRNISLRRPSFLTPRVLLWAIAVAAFAGAGAVGLAIGAWRNLCADCPSIAQIETWRPEQTSKLLSRNGELIAELGYERRTPVSIQALPTYVPQAVIAIEDKRFYEHSGYDPIGIGRAVVGKLTRRYRGGGSTITQQLARNMFEGEIGFARRITRKLKELQVALALERTYEKDQILEAYLNEIYMGRGYGFQNAARNYFGKDVTEVNVAEAALLAAILNLPGYYNPFTHPENALRRRNIVLNLMAEQGYLTEEEAEHWKEWPLPVEDEIDPYGHGLAPYFEEWVRQELDARFGQDLYREGLRIVTTLDVEMQKAAEEAMAYGWDKIESNAAFQHPKYEEFADKDTTFAGGTTPYLQGMMVVMDPLTGDVLAMIGGRDFRQSKFNRATQARRQPGSAFKPFVYTTALASGIPASRAILDGPVVLEQVDGTEWRPENFSETFEGWMPMREGLKRSINTVAIKVGQLVEIGTVRQLAREMGIRSTPIAPVPSSFIGASEVIPVELAAAYTGFATLGNPVQPRYVLRVEDAEGNLLWEPQVERREGVLDVRVARIAVDMLQDVVNEGTGYTGVRLLGQVPYEVPVGGKTGTTNESGDVWFMGFTPNLVAGVWFGFDIRQRIYPKATGGTDASPVWGRFARRVYFGETSAATPDSLAILPIPEEWAMPDGITTRRVDFETGLLASPWCPEEQAYDEIFIAGTEPTTRCGIRRRGRIGRD